MKNKDNFDYTVASSKDFDSTVADLQTEIEKNGMRVLYIHDVQATLAQKGLARDPFKMIEFCKADYAHTLLEIDPRVSVFLPCKISVYIQDGKIHMSVLDFDHVAALFSDKFIRDILSEINKILRKVINNQ